MTTLEWAQARLRKSRAAMNKEKSKDQNGRAFKDAEANWQRWNEVVMALMLADMEDKE